MSSGQQGGKSGGGNVSGSVVVGIAVVTALAVGLSVFAYLGRMYEPTPIAEIHSNLRKFDGTSVTVRGEVEETYNLLGIKWFRLRDDSGSIVVVTQRGLPERGRELTTTGIVKEMFNLGGVNATVLQEPLAPQD